MVKMCLHTHFYNFDSKHNLSSTDIWLVFNTNNVLELIFKIFDPEIMELEIID